jgi:hypothetical protein
MEITALQGLKHQVECRSLTVSDYFGD